MGLIALERKMTRKRSPRLMMKKRCHIDKLSNDELMEILIRLPLFSGDVHRCKAVTKRWLNLISHPSFAHSYVQFHHQLRQQRRWRYYDTHEDFLLLSGYGPQKTGATNINYIERKPNISKFFDFSFSFVPPLSTPNLKGFTLLRVFQGLVLSEAQFPTSLALYVCNPLTKQWVEIPYPTSSRLQPGAVGFMCQETCTGGGTLLLTVIAVSKDDIQQCFVVRLFTSDDFQWRLYRVPYPSGFSWPKTINMVVCNGMFHWNGQSNIVVYDPSRKGYRRRCDFINMPADAVGVTGACSDGCCIDISQGLIRLYDFIPPVYSYAGEKMQFWDLVDYGERLWSPKFRVGSSSCDFKCFSETNRDILYTTYSDTDMIVCETTKRVDVCYWNDFFALKGRGDYSTAKQILPYVTPMWPIPLPRLKI